LKGLKIDADNKSSALQPLERDVMRLAQQQMCLQKMELFYGSWYSSEVTTALLFDCTVPPQFPLLVHRIKAY